MTETQHRLIICAALSSISAGGVGAHFNSPGLFFGVFAFALLIFVTLNPRDQ